MLNMSEKPHHHHHHHHTHHQDEEVPVPPTVGELAPISSNVVSSSSSLSSSSSSSSSAEGEVDHQIPDGGYGWIIVASVCTINAFTWGVFGSYGVYLAYYLSTSHFVGATPLDYAYIGGLNFGVSMLVASPVTYLVRMMGMHAVMFIGIAIQTAGFIAASFAESIWQLYLTQGICVGLGVGLLFIPSVAVTSQWFDKKRSLANSINSAGSGLGGIIISFATRPMIDNISLAWSLRIIGIVSGSVNIIATCLLRNRNKVIRPVMHPFDVRLLRRLPVVLLLAWGFFSMLGYIVLLYSLSDFARSVGWSTKKASSLTALMNLGTAVGRPLVGFLSDRYGRIEVAGLATLASSIGIWAFWLPTINYGLAIFFAIFEGAFIGVFWMTISTLCVEVAGLVELPSMLALAFGSVILPTTFAEVIALKIKQPDTSRPYLYPQIWTGMAYLIASGLMLGLWMIVRRNKRSG